MRIGYIVRYMLSNVFHDNVLKIEFLSVLLQYFHYFLLDLLHHAVANQILLFENLLFYSKFTFWFYLICDMSGKDLPLRTTAVTHP